MKKNELIQQLAQYRTDDPKVLGHLLFKGQDSEAIRQLKAILQHRNVVSLAFDAELPIAAIEAIQRVIAEATNIDLETQAVLDGLNQALSRSGVNSTACASSNSQASSSTPSVAAANITSSASAAPVYFKPRPDGLSFFCDMSADVFENIMAYLPDATNRDALSIALCTTKSSAEYNEDVSVGHSFARAVAMINLNASKKELKERLNKFLQAVTDADLEGATKILESMKSNRRLLKLFLTAVGECPQKNGITMRGNALTIAIKCWDWSMCEGGKPAMAETLMEYMRLLPDGESLIQAQMQTLFPQGVEAHLKEQETQAAEFAKTILEPLAELIKTASDEDFKLAYGLTDVKNEDVDTYIAKNLNGKPFWEALMQWRAAIKKVMEETPYFNPYLLQQAFRVSVAKYETEEWQDRLGSGRDRLGLLSIHAIGGIQAFSPRLVQMLFARGSICEFYEMTPDQRKNFEQERATEFKYSGGDVGDCSSLGRVLLGLICWSFGAGFGGSSGWLAAGRLDWNLFVEQKPSPWKSYAPLLNRTNSDFESKPVMRN